jgi:hypothetical protein
VTGSNSGDKGEQPPIIGVLDGGPSLRLLGPTGAARAIAKSGTAYAATLGDGSPGSFLEPGSFTLSGTGGADIGAFSAPFTILPFTWTNQPANNGSLQINRSQGVKITWTGGDPNGYIQIQGGGGGNGINANFVCNASTGDGSFTIPPSLLLAMPANSAGGFNVIAKSAATIFTATGLDFGGVTMEQNIFSSAQYQ